MSGSGLAELMEIVYAPTAVTHMLTGKAVSRAVRGHFLVDTALTAIIMITLYGVSIPGTNELKEDVPDQFQHADNSHSTQNELCEAAALLDSLMEGLASVDMVCKCKILDTIKSDFENMKLSQLEYRTSRLWFQYLDMIDILRRFIKAERTGNWQLHLQSFQEMLPYLAAAGHNLYVKSIRIYLLQMELLETENHEVFEFFQSGYNVIRRSEAYWSGISSDLAIEQSLMRSLKTTGGMTRGRGMSESQRAQWILSMPDCSDINNAMQEFANVSYSTSSQHKESGASRRYKDSNDVQTLALYLADRNPFLKEPALRDIETGVTADSNVNADNAKEVGTAILQSMDRKRVKEHVFKRNQQVITLGQKSSIKINDETISVDPQLLFQRFIVAADNICEDKAQIFTYELCAYPSAMFESSGFMRSAQKSTLLDAIWNIGDCKTEILTTDICYVIDGGSLLHHVNWQSSTTFGQICQQYINFVQRLKAEATVVFDGYCSGPDTKDELHFRRNRGIIGTKVRFDENTPFKSKKDAFMANRQNKQNFINMLSEKLVENGFETKHAEADADVLIARTAVSCTITKTTVLLGEDTDLLVLLLYHAKNLKHQLIFKSESSNEKSKIWDITKTRAVLGESMCQIIPVLHAITGCDTTSRFFGIGKSPIFKKVMENDDLKLQAGVFISTSSSKESVIAAGESLICAMYNGLPYENLDTLRYRKFVNGVTVSKTFLQVHTLPPTSAAAAYHSLRTFYQVQTWTEEQLLNPREWGWMLSDEKLLPIKTNKTAAPEHILRIIRYQCKTNCETKRCNCRKHGMTCSTACGDCKGISCTNSPKPVTDELCE